MTSKKTPCFQNIILALQEFWAQRDCVILQPYDVEMGAGTFHPATTLRCLGSKPWKTAYVQPSRRPTDGRYGDNPNRLQSYYQFQVILKPSPEDIQEQLISSLEAIGIDASVHDIRFVEDNWESPTLGAAGLGWEVWCDGQEIVQFTFFQQLGGRPCFPVPVELTYGLERCAAAVQGIENVYDLDWNGGSGEDKVTYGDVFLENERQFSAYNFEHARVEDLKQQFVQCENTCHDLIAKNLPLPAYDQALKASHLFNLLDARGVIGVLERQAYIARVRDLARGCCDAYLELIEPEAFSKDNPNTPTGKELK